VLPDAENTALVSGCCGFAWLLASAVHGQSHGQAGTGRRFEPTGCQPLPKHPLVPSRAPPTGGARARPLGRRFGAGAVPGGRPGGSTWSQPHPRASATVASAYRPEPGSSTSQLILRVSILVGRRRESSVCTQLQTDSAAANSSTSCHRRERADMRTYFRPAKAPRPRDSLAQVDRAALDHELTRRRYSRSRARRRSRSAMALRPFSSG